MKRRDFIRTATFCAAAVAGFAGLNVNAGAAAKRPNIVLIVSDDHGTGEASQGQPFL